MAPDDADPLLGQLVGSWRVSRLLGEGGMGRVYLAIQPSIGSRVAIKVLTSAGQSRSAVERFFAEARAVNLIRHENIVNVLDLASLPDGRPYIVMEYLSGVSLRQIIKQRAPLPLGSLARLLCEVLGALQAAHEKGIIHRDLKPDNIQVTPGGHAMVLDFGIAKLTTGDSQAPATKTGAVMGTPAYMSPEQAAEETVGPASDLYSLGIILYEGATGGRPFTAATTFELMRAHLVVPAPPPSERRANLPPALAAVMLRALEKRPEQRFASATEMASALEAALVELPASAFSNLGVASGAFAAVTEGGGATAPAPETAAPSDEPGPTVPLKPATPGPRPVPSLRSVAPIPPAATPRRTWLWLALSLGAVAAAALALLMFRRAPRPDPTPPPAHAAAPPLDAGPPPPLRTIVHEVSHYDAQDHMPFDVMTGVNLALNDARQVVSDVQLVHFTAFAVGAKGFTDLAAGGSVEYVYRSPSRSPRVEGSPDLERRCLIAVEVTQRGIDVVELPDLQCEDAPVRAPECPTATIWRRLLGPKAAPDRTVTMRYQRSGVPPKPRWIAVSVMQIADDDCGQ